MIFDLKKKKAIKNFLFQEGRLLERKIYSVIFENEAEISFFNALKAYQNFDKGFGNGLEPDLLVPDSTGIATETALCLLDMMDLSDTKLIREISGWAYNHINEAGIIPHPPKDLKSFPHQSWWENPDDDRILAISGFLSKFKAVNPDSEQKIVDRIINVKLPEKIEIYDYPLFIYAIYHKEYKGREKVLNYFIELLPGLIEKNREHHILFGRYWYHAITLLPQKIVNASAEYVIRNIKEDGGIVNPYPQLPWWRPIFTLDALLLLKKFHFIN